MNFRRLPIATVVSISLLTGTTGCRLDGLADAIACVLDFGPFVTTPSDKGILRAAVTCTEGSDCSEGREIHAGARIEFVIEVPARHVDGVLEVRSDPEGHMEIEGFSAEVECEDDREISGAVTFDQPGEGAFVVLSDGEEIDRFTVDVQEPASVDIEGYFGPFETTSGITLDEMWTLRAVVRGPSGDRLVAGPAPTWITADPGIVAFDDGAATITGAIVSVHPVASGATSVHVAVGKLASSLPVEVGGAGGMGGESP